MIYFDLDGVLRNLAHEVFGKEPNEWWELTEKGQNLIEYVDSNLHVLKDAKPLEYLDLFKFLYHDVGVQIMTAQYPHWIPYTLQWLYINMPYLMLKDILFVSHPSAKLKILMPEDILIDDHPEYTNHSQVVLVDHPYNKLTLSKHRVSNKEELWLKLTKLIPDLGTILV